MKNINAADIIRVLGGDERSGMCRCPAHADDNPSLSVRDADDKVLVHCHAGCPQEAVVGELKARGLWPEGDDDWNKIAFRPPEERARDDDDDLFRSFERAMDILRAAGRSNAPKRYLNNRAITIIPSCAKMLDEGAAGALTGYRYPVMVCPITNEQHLIQGAHLTFLTSNGTANLVGDHGKIRRIYGQAKGGFVRLGRIDPDSPLIIGEGIEAVLSAMQLSGIEGGIAVGSANNMKVIVPPPCSEIIIAADNDNSGRMASEALAERLAVPGRVVRVACPTGCNDWNHVLAEPVEDLDVLKRRILEARVVLPPTSTAALGMDAFMAMAFPKRQYLLQPWLTTSGLAMLYAEPGSGKTRLALSIAYSVATGKALMGWHSERRARVLYVDGELPGTLLQEWLQCLGPVLPDSDFQILSHAALESRGRTMPDLGTEEGRRYLDEVIERSGAELIILDSISTLVRSGVENDAESWRAVQDWSMKHRLRGRTVLFLHHTARSGKARGSSMREVTIDTALRLRGLPDESTETSTAVELSFPKARHFFGKDAMAQVVRFSTTSGKIEWTAEVKTPAHVEEVRALLKEGLKQNEIAEKLGLTKGRVSQIVKEINAQEAEGDPEGLAV